MSLKGEMGHGRDNVIFKRIIGGWMQRAGLIIVGICIGRRIGRLRLLLVCPCGMRRRPNVGRSGIGVPRSSTAKRRGRCCCCPVTISIFSRAIYIFSFFWVLRRIVPGGILLAHANQTLLLAVHVAFALFWRRHQTSAKKDTSSERNNQSTCFSPFSVI